MTVEILTQRIDALKAEYREIATAFRTVSRQLGGDNGGSHAIRQAMVHERMAQDLDKLTEEPETPNV